MIDKLPVLHENTVQFSHVKEKLRPDGTAATTTELLTMARAHGDPAVGVAVIELKGTPRACGPDCPAVDLVIKYPDEATARQAFVGFVTAITFKNLLRGLGGMEESK